MQDAGFWRLDAGFYMLYAEFWISHTVRLRPSKPGLEAGGWILDTGCRMLDSGV